MRGGARPGAGRPRGEGYQTVAIALPRSEAAVLRERAAAADKTVSRYVADELKLKEENMSETLKEAINIFMSKVKPWEMTPAERRNLNLAMKGDAGAFCDLLASQGMQRMPEFNAVFAEINADGE